VISLCQNASKTEAFRRGLRLGVIPFVGAKQEALEELLDVDSMIYGANRYQRKTPKPQHRKNSKESPVGGSTGWAVLRTPGEWGSPRGKTSS
jgi:hypothetical protein